jgi:predicted chitinase
MKKLLITEEEKNLIRSMYGLIKESSLGLTVELEGEEENLSWLESAEGILYDYPEYYKDYQDEFKWPVPGINLKYLDKLKDTFAKSKKGICYNEHPKCYTKVLVYAKDKKSKEVEFKQYDFKWDKKNKKGEFVDSGINLLPGIEVIGYKEGGDKVSNASKKISNRLKSFGVTDPKVIGAIIGVCSKESGFVLQGENTHTGTIDQLRDWFPPLRNFTDQEIEKLRLNQRRFYNKVYGPTTETGKNLGNVNKDDGYNYRGRGWNGITGRNLYRLVGYERNPDALNNTDDATKALINYYDKVSGILKKEYSDDTPMSTIVRDFIYATGGFSPNSNSPFIQTNYQRAYNFVVNNLIKDGKLYVPGFDPIKVNI